MTGPQLTQELHRLADQAHPARVTADTWRRGRRRHRIKAAAVTLAVVTAVASVPLLFGQAGRTGVVPADTSRPAVPSIVYPPVTGERTFVEAPPGPAAILVTGDHELRGSDIWGWEGRSLLVARDGSYRLARTEGETTAGTAGGLLLSPDGRYMAGLPSIEGSHWVSAERRPPLPT